MHPASLLALDTTTQLTSPAVNGLVTGCVYGLLALAIVLVYKGNRFFNFAVAEIGTVAMLVAQAFRTGDGAPRLPFPVACVIGIAAGVLTSLVVERVVIRPLFRASRVTLVVATTGVALVLVQGGFLFYGLEGGSFPAISRTPLFTDGVLRPTVSDLLITLSLAGAGIAAVAFFRSRYGNAVLAVSMDPTAASAVGISVSRVSMLTWGLAGFLGSLAGVAYAPRLSIVGPGILTFGGTLVFAFVAAVIGGMTSLPGAFAGGIIVGLVQAFSLQLKTDVAAIGDIPGFNNLVIFALLLVVLLARPTGLLGKET